MLGAGCAELPPAPQSSATITVDTAATRQVLHGFGSTHAFAVVVDDRMTGDQWRRAISALAVEIGSRTGTAPAPAEDRRAKPLEPAARFSRPLDFHGVDSLFRLYGRYSPEGIGDIVPFASINTRWAHRWLNELKTTDYPRYLDEIAGKAVATVADWKRRSGREPELLQLWNEPVTGNRELAGGTSADLLAIIKHTGRRLREAGYSKVRFLAGNEETVGASLKDLRAIAEDEEARGYVGAIGYHSYPYGSDYSYVPRLLASRARGVEPPSAAERRELRALSRSLGIPVWMTEVSNGYSPGGPRAAKESYVPDSIDWIVGRAAHIHDEFRFAGASAYFGMLAIWTDREDRNHFPDGGSKNLRSEGDNLLLVDTAADEVIITGMGRAMGHYGRWLRRGARYLESESSSPFVLVSPFLDRGRLVVVLVNVARLPVRTVLQLRSMEFAGTLVGEQTRAGAAWAALGSFNVRGPALTLDLPAWSLTTVAVPLR
jgi:hypothetical protein